MGIAMIIFIILGILSLIIACAIDSEFFAYCSGICMATCFILMIVGCFTGFVNCPPTEGTHVGVVTAVDLEGVYFRRYEVYLKSSGYTGQSDETKYLLYDYEKELAEKLKNAIGKNVKLHYGHDGGYIGWKSCGTYHIKDVEVIEENK